MKVADAIQSTVSLTIAGVTQARADFVRGEPRNLFYLVATGLIDLARKGTAKSVSVVQALAVLLETWNSQFNRFRGGFHESDLLSIEALLRDHAAALEVFRSREIAGFAPGEERQVQALFASFEKNLGAVGAAKCLHLLAPNFFPLWDNKIARAYHVRLKPDGYIRFMQEAQKQCISLKQQGAPWSDLLKAIDECNYCAYTLNDRRKSRVNKRKYA
jgi:hypothetical protein